MRQRLIRVLVYEGTPEWIAKALADRGIKGSRKSRDGNIREAIVGDFLEVVDDRSEVDKDARRFQYLIETPNRATEILRRFGEEGMVVTQEMFIQWLDRAMEEDNASGA